MRIKTIISALTSSSAIAERPRCIMRQFWPKVKTIFCRHYRSIFIQRLRSFKVTDVRTNGKPVCNFPLVINTNWHPILYRFKVIAVYCSKFGHFVFFGPLVVLGAMYNVHLRLIAKLVVDFLLVITELFLLRVTAEALIMDIHVDWKSAYLKRRCQLGPKFQVEWVIPHQPVSLSQN